MAWSLIVIVFGQFLNFGMALLVKTLLFFFFRLKRTIPCFGESGRERGTSLCFRLSRRISSSLRNSMGEAGCEDPHIHLVRWLQSAHGRGLRIARRTHWTGFPQLELSARVRSRLVRMQSPFSQSPSRADSKWNVGASGRAWYVYIQTNIGASACFEASKTIIKGFPFSPFIIHRTFLSICLCLVVCLPAANQWLKPRATFQFKKFNSIFVSWIYSIIYWVLTCAAPNVAFITIVRRLDCQAFSQLVPDSCDCLLI